MKGRPMNRSLGFALMLSLSPHLHAAGSPAGQAPRAIPLEDFFRNVERTAYRLSPDGRWIAYLAPHANRLNLFVQAGPEGHPKRLTASTAENIQAFRWVDSARLLYLVDTGGNRDFRLFVVDRDGTEPRCLIDTPGASARIVDLWEPRPEEIIVGLNQRDRSFWDLYRLHLTTGELRPFLENPGDFDEWTFDHLGSVRMVTATDGATKKILYRQGDGQPLRPILSFSAHEDLFRPQFFTPDNRRVYAYSNLGRDKVAIVEFDPVQKRETRVLLDHPTYDLFGDDEADLLAWSPVLNDVAYALYTTWRRRHHFFDPVSARRFAGLQQKFPGYVVRIVSSDRTEQRHIVKITSDRQKGAYHLLDESQGKITFLGQACPWLREDDLASKEPIEFEAPDGRTIHGYLTLPRRAQPHKLPVVVFPHAGPQWRNSWELFHDLDVQFLASRGYAVLQVNFRGSTGYGRRFLLAGYKQNGLAVQDDITAGVEYLIREKIADPDRIAIYGLSYGGYAALAGLAFTPDLYACGVDLYGVSNFFTFFEAFPPSWDKSFFYDTIGHPERDKDQLERTSPALQADRIKAPLLIAQGARDPTISRRESDQMVAALRRRGVEVEYILEPDEGHGFDKEENRIELWRRIEAFLARHIGDP
jgi:dipeptidyl aminopeptidase/acylaminoacyl peptidase